ncbi:CRISPR-associated protein Csd1 [Rhodopseudomonas rhenobacensis]|uniref:CRISPR-associated protein Csd1 n=1 Tax=Rhodopseudomonas rhenobacensis TaxID=87461 RepID=A0A7W8DWS9_9BRAD|nr:type I-C CRISPR-associated protein Cas8c/Csd1 [Rhodopseudomonas rhenobacensis]MBB5045409.1 CRISPR-associated protein Csd1 [Rhodopseudomonas rhenobacensis]
MSALAALVRAYDRLSANGEDVPAFGYAAQDIQICIILASDGSQVGGPVVWDRDKTGKPLSRTMNVPYFGGRSGSKAPPYFLWDNTAYVLGVSAKASYDPLARHRAFKEFHLGALASIDDEALQAVCRFLNRWSPDQFSSAGFTDDLKDKNLVFRFKSERNFIHERSAAKDCWEKIYQPDVIGEGLCLISGERSQIARLHPPIRTFDNPARIVSFDLDSDAFASYENIQGANAPTGIKAAFAYTAVLNRFLSKGSGHRIQIGDASCVFWADASDTATAEAAEDEFSFLMGANEKLEEKKLNALLNAISQGRPSNNLPMIFAGVRFFVMGLSPNNARLFLRFYIEDDFAKIARRLAQHLEDLSLEPLPFKQPPAAWALLYETSVHVPKAGPNGRTIWERAKNSNPPAILSGDLMRAVLTGARYPRTLLSAIIRRVRAEGGRVTGKRVAICKAIINREIRLSTRRKGVRDSQITPRQETIPVALDRENPNTAYRLGRLFALLERLQELALPNLNATIRDRSFAAASTTPLRVFPQLIKTSQHHASAARKDIASRKLSFWLENQIGDVWSGLSPDLPRTLRLDDQARFHAGYYHQRFAKSDKAGENNLATVSNHDSGSEESDKE